MEEAIQKVIEAAIQWEKVSHHQGTVEEYFCACNMLEAAVREYRALISSSPRALA